MRAEFPLPHGDAPLLRNILANLSLYRGLATEHVDLLADASLPLRTRGATQLIRQGAPATGVHIVVHGQVRVYFERGDGAEKTLAILGYGRSFGLAESVLNQPHLAIARTISDGMIVYTPREKILDVARESPDFAERLICQVAHQAYRLMEDVKRQTVNTAPQRLAGFLLRQSRYHSSKSIELDISKTLIASKLGIANETFSRLLHRFSDQGLIEVRGRYIRILDPKGISAMQPA